MSRKKLLLLSTVVLALFAFIYLFERKTPSTAERQLKGELHWDLPEERIQEIRLEHSGILIELVKGEGDSWKIVRPEAYPADKTAVTDLVSELSDLKRAGGEEVEARPEDYGLKPPSAKATVVWTEEKEPAKRETRTVELGVEVPGTDVTAARLAGSPSVVFVPSSVATVVRKNVNDFKSKELFGGVSAFDVSRIDLERWRGKLVLARKSGVWWLDQPFSDLADSEAAERLAGDVTALRVQEFLTAADRSDLATLGLNPPLYRVTLSQAKGKGTTVEFGATRSDGSSLYGRRDGQVFTVENTIVEELSKETVAFRSPGLLRFDRGQVSAVEGAFGNVRYALSRKEGAWSLGEKPVIAPAADDLLSALLDLKSRSFLDEAEARVLAGREAVAKVAVTVSPSSRWEVQFYPIRGTIEATVSRRPGAFKLAGDAVTTLEAAFQKLAQTPTPMAGNRKS